MTTARQSSEPDIISALQNQLDELATQLYAALRYTSTYHPSSASSALAANVINPPAKGAGQPGSPGDAAPAAPAAPTAVAAAQDSASAWQSAQIPGSPSHVPHTPTTFDADLAELAGDLVAKQREIETLIAQLPRDLASTRSAQEARIRDLAAQLVSVEDRSRAVQRRRDEVVGCVEGVIARFRRV